MTFLYPQEKKESEHRRTRLKEWTVVAGRFDLALIHIGKLACLIDRWKRFLWNDTPSSNETCTYDDR